MKFLSVIIELRHRDIWITKAAEMVLLSSSSYAAHTMNLRLFFASNVRHVGLLTVVKLLLDRQFALCQHSALH